MTQSNQQQQQKESMKTEKWSIDLTSIGENGNGQNALKLQKRELLAWILCILLAIICGALIYGAFLLLSNANSSNPEHSQMSENKDDKQIDDVLGLHNKTGQEFQQNDQLKSLSSMPTALKYGLYIAVAMLPLLFIVNIAIILNRIGWDIQQWEFRDYWDYFFNVSFFLYSLKLLLLDLPRIFPL